ncbi:aldehyde dehydrogenase family protein [Gemmobacter sp.]|uniref:aldehyde dehydrogenase family protein n=1 Tax=Gemmobacter sp. TaxID=1898957 RepID=UPI002AFEE609|nr:aldehyde dehydrogenase family protein [Gemmobacter sp.]
MNHLDRFYIGGAWVAPASPALIPVENPATGAIVAHVAQGTAADVDAAVAAARKAFDTGACGDREFRLALLRRILAAYGDHQSRIGDLIADEIGAPRAFARNVQAGSALNHLRKAIEVLENYAFEDLRGTTMVRHEPIGVAGLITPWNWPINQVACKVFPALAAGCSMVLKPSELSPLSAIALTELLHDAGVPPGVFNLVQGEGPEVGEALARHPGVDMISLTGSARAGAAVTVAAAPTVKRVCLELGGKAANILLDDVDLEAAVTRGVQNCMRNAGQSCSAPTRMLVPHAQMGRAATIAAQVADGLKVGPPDAEGVDLGPLISARQLERVRAYIDSGIAEGARLVAGGPDRPEALAAGHFVRPTVFADVTPDMRIAQEEIFGPVLCLIGYGSDDEAVAIANGTVFGLTAYVQSPDLDRARAIARRLRAGSVLLNYAPVDPNGPFGGFKQSGNGREYGIFGFEEFLEVKGMVGYA